MFTEETLVHVAILGMRAHLIIFFLMLGTVRCIWIVTAVEEYGLINVAYFVFLNGKELRRIL